MESSNENVVARKRGKVRKLTKAEIEVYGGGKSLQPRVLFTKLKDIALPLEKQKSRKRCQTKAVKKANLKIYLPLEIETHLD